LELSESSDAIEATLRRIGDAAPRYESRSTTELTIFGSAEVCNPTACMLICMQSTSVRIDSDTHDELKRLAHDLGTTVGHTVTLAVRALRQDRVGDQLGHPLREDETAWLDADLG